MNNSNFKVMLVFLIVLLVIGVTSGILVGRHIKKQRRDDTQRDIAHAFKNNQVVVVNEKVKLVKVPCNTAPLIRVKVYRDVTAIGKKYKLKKGEIYFIRTMDNTSMGGEYLGARKLGGKKFLVFKGRTAMCRGKSSCWMKRNIALSKIVEITNQDSDQVCKKDLCKND